MTELYKSISNTYQNHSNRNCQNRMWSKGFCFVLFFIVNTFSCLTLQEVVILFWGSEKIIFLFLAANRAAQEATFALVPQCQVGTW